VDPANSTINRGAQFIIARTADFDYTYDEPNEAIIVGLVIGDGADRFFNDAGRCLLLAGTDRRGTLGSRNSTVATVLVLLLSIMAPAWGQIYEDAKLIASDGDDGDWFGDAVSICGSSALIGAKADDDQGQNSGSAYVYDLPTSLLVDIKCNGQDHNLIVTSAETVKATIEIEAGGMAGRPVDIWVFSSRYNYSNTWSYSYYGRLLRRSFLDVGPEKCLLHRRTHQ